MASTAIASAEKWYGQLKHIDEHTRREREWLSDISACLLANDFHSLADLRGATMEELTEARPIGAKLAFLRRTVEAANSVEQGRVGPPNALDAVQCLLAGQGASANPRKVVNIPCALDNASLSRLPPSTWPCADFVDWLKNEVDRLRLKGVEYPFIFVELKKRCAPNWAPEHAALAANDAEPEENSAICAIAQAIRGEAPSKREGKYLSVICWVAAFHRFALAAEFAGMWPLACSMAHLDVCLRVGEEARGRGKPQFLACIYDEVCRKHWSELARANVSDFNLKQPCTSIDKDLLSRAESVMASRALPTKAMHDKQRHPAGQLALPAPPPRPQEPSRGEWDRKRKRSY